MSEERDNSVLAPNATIVQNVAADPPTVKPDYAFPVAGGDGYVAVRNGYEIEKVEAPLVGIPAHTLSTLDDLARYLIRNFADDAATTDIVLQKDKVVATIDPKDTQPIVVGCDLALHPCWSSWMAVANGKPLSQKALMQHIRAWRETVENGDQLMQAFGMIQVIGGSKFTSQVDETGSTRLVSGEDSKSLNVKIPPTIKFTSPVYDGVLDSADPLSASEQQYDCELLLSVDTDTPVTFALAFPKLELVLRAARADAARYLQALLGDRWLVSVGQSGHATRAAIG